MENEKSKIEKPSMVPMDKSLLILTVVAVLIGIIIIFSCYVRRRDRVVYLCKEIIETGDECYRCTECSKTAKTYLCSACFEASIHTEHTYEVIKVGRGGTVRCHCGLRDSWLPTIGTDRMCRDHQNNLKARIESSCKFIEIKGMKVPVSPDGIPMVNLAKPLEETEEEKSTPKKVDIRSGGMTTCKFLQPNLPKIAGDRYRPAAWIPYKRYDDDNWSTPKTERPQFNRKQFRFLIKKTSIEVANEMQETLNKSQKRSNYSDYSSGRSSR